MEVVQLKKVSETYNKVICDPGIAYELRDHFTFDVPGAKFMPAFRNKMWDGKIRLFDTRNNRLYNGLIPYLEDFKKIVDEMVKASAETPPKAEV